MLKASGFDRVVYLIGCLAIKFPNFKDAFSPKMRQKRHPFFGIFRKILKNWYEFWFYFRTRHEFCAPTYFSLLGLVNIQRRVEPVPEAMALPLWQGIYDVTDNRFRELGYSGHTLSHHRNFGLHRGRLVLCDYTKVRDQKFILAHGTKLQRYVAENTPE